MNSLKLNSMQKVLKQLKSGTEPRLAGHGMRSMVNNYGSTWNQKNRHASTAIRILRTKTIFNPNFVQGHVSLPQEGNPVLMTKADNVKFALKNSLSTGTQKQSLAVSHVVTELVVIQGGQKQVYDITVEGEHEYFANGILVHNCLDAWGYVERDREAGEMYITQGN